MTYDLPENDSCVEVNPALWEIFLDSYLAKYHTRPSPRMWTEESVVQWFDRQDVYNDLVDYTD